MSEDGVNHPSHYNQYSGFEVIDVCEQLRAPDNTGNYNRGNAFKYLARAGWKNPNKHVEDLEKAKFYIQREIDRITSNNWMDSDQPASAQSSGLLCPKCDLEMRLSPVQSDDGTLWYFCEQRHGSMQVSKSTAPEIAPVPPVGGNVYLDQSQTVPTIVLEERRPLCSTCKYELSLIHNQNLGCVNKDCEQGLKNLKRLMHGV